MKQLRVGIIGLGVGQQHIEGYQSHPDCQVTALCDFSETKLNEVQKKYSNCSFTKNADDMLRNPQVDVISIATYDNYHYEQIVKALKHNKHVFVEKPLCLYEKEASGIRRLLKSKPHLKLSSNLILRKSPRFCLLKEMIKAGQMGNLFYVEGDYNYGRIHKITDGWRGKIDFYSVVYGGGVHIIDLLLWLTGDKVIEVFAYGTNLATRESNFRYNDTVVCILKFSSGLIGKMTANFGCVFPHFHALSIYGTKATFINGLEYGLLFDSSRPNAGYQKVDSPYPGVHKGGLIYNFVDSIIYGTEQTVCAEDIFSAMSVCFAIQKAVDKQKPTRVRYI